MALSRLTIWRFEAMASTGGVLGEKESVLDLAERCYTGPSPRQEQFCRVAGHGGLEPVQRLRRVCQFAVLLHRATGERLNRVKDGE